MRARMPVLIGLSVLVAGAAVALVCTVAAPALGVSGSARGSESRHSLQPPSNTPLTGEPVVIAAPAHQIYEVGEPPPHLGLLISVSPRT